eukprot:TRINITY_DN2475_c0_g1_i1.p1 TRINITY_DN2475_c0_g1~~TRINITY_DN2475_c0_g1_i1.p1  ORF type:complete len:2415 (+),score=438.48 TRINITY_DN2475_c0_g1_i1:968-7246(+)
MTKDAIYSYELPRYNISNRPAFSHHRLIHLTGYFENYNPSTVVIMKGPYYSFTSYVTAVSEKSDEVMIISSSDHKGYHTAIKMGPHDTYNMLRVDVSSSTNTPLSYGIDPSMFKPTFKMCTNIHSNGTFCFLNTSEGNMIYEEKQSGMHLLFVNYNTTELMHNNTVFIGNEDVVCFMGHNSTHVSGFFVDLKTYVNQTFSLEVEPITDGIVPYVSTYGSNYRLTILYNKTYGQRYEFNTTNFDLLNTDNLTVESVRNYTILGNSTVYNHLKNRIEFFGYDLHDALIKMYFDVGTLESTTQVNVFFSGMSFSVRRAAGTVAYAIMSDYGPAFALKISNYNYLLQFTPYDTYYVSQYYNSIMYFGFSFIRRNGFNLPFYRAYTSLTYQVIISADHYALSSNGNTFEYSSSYHANTTKSLYKSRRMPLMEFDIYHQCCNSAYPTLGFPLEKASIAERTEFKILTAPSEYFNTSCTTIRPVYIHNTSFAMSVPGIYTYTVYRESYRYNYSEVVNITTMAEYFDTDDHSNIYRSSDYVYATYHNSTDNSFLMNVKAISNNYYSYYFLAGNSINSTMYRKYPNGTQLLFDFPLIETNTYRVCEYYYQNSYYTNGNNSFVLYFYSDCMSRFNSTGKKLVCYTVDSYKRRVEIPLDNHGTPNSNTYIGNYYFDPAVFSYQSTLTCNIELPNGQILYRRDYVGVNATINFLTRVSPAFINCVTERCDFSVNFTFMNQWQILQNGTLFLQGITSHYDNHYPMIGEEGILNQTYAANTIITKSGSFKNVVAGGYELRYQYGSYNYYLGNVRIANYDVKNMFSLENGVLIGYDVDIYGGLSYSFSNSDAAVDYIDVIVNDENFVISGSQRYLRASELNFKPALSYNVKLVDLASPSVIISEHTFETGLTTPVSYFLSAFSDSNGKLSLNFNSDLSISREWRLSFVCVEEGKVATRFSSNYYTLNDFSSNYAALCGCNSYRVDLIDTKNVLLDSLNFTFNDGACTTTTTSSSGISVTSFEPSKFYSFNAPDYISFTFTGTLLSDMSNCKVRYEFEGLIVHTASCYDITTSTLKAKFMYGTLPSTLFKQLDISISLDGTTFKTISNKITVYGVPSIVSISTSEFTASGGDSAKIIFKGGPIDEAKMISIKIYKDAKTFGQSLGSMESVGEVSFTMPEISDNVTSVNIALSLDGQVYSQPISVTILSNVYVGFSLQSEYIIFSDTTVDVTELNFTIKTSSESDFAFNVSVFSVNSTMIHFIQKDAFTTITGNHTVSLKASDLSVSMTSLIFQIEPIGVTSTVITKNSTVLVLPKPPKFFSASPLSGPQMGGTLVTLTGENFPLDKKPIIKFIGDYKEVYTRTNGTIVNSNNITFTTLAFPIAASLYIEISWQGTTFERTPFKFTFIPCSKGWYSEYYYSQCVECPVGTYSEELGSRSCSKCAIGNYQNVTGSSSCYSCPTGAITSKTGSTWIGDCLCDEGYYGDGLECTECPEGGKCSLGSSTPEAISGYFINLENPTVVLNCYPKEACPGGSAVNITAAVCNTGFIGERCSECPSGFFKKQEKCLQCPESNIFIIVGIFVFFGVIIGGALIIAGDAVEVLNDGQDMVEDIGENLEGLMEFSGEAMNKGVEAIKSLGSNFNIDISSILTFFSFAQITSFFDQLDLNWPDFIKQALYWLKTFNFDINILNPSCVFAYSFIDFTKIQILLPVIIFGILILLNIIFWIFRRFNVKSAMKFMDRSIAAFMTIIVYCYAFVGQSAIDYFDCVSLTDGRKVLKKSPNVVCWSDAHISNMMIPVLSIVFFVIGLPIAYFFTIRHFRDANKLNSPRSKRYFGKLYDGYKDSVCYWETFGLLRKLLIVLAIVFLSSNATDSALISIFFLFAALMGQAIVQPYNSTLDNISETAALLCAVVIVFSGIIMDANSISPLMTNVLSGIVSILLFVNIYICLGGFLLQWFNIPILSRFKEEDDDDENEDDKKSDNNSDQKYLDSDKGEVNGHLEIDISFEQPTATFSVPYPDTSEEIQEEKKIKQIEVTIAETAVNPIEDTQEELQANGIVEDVEIDDRFEFRNQEKDEEEKEVKEDNVVVEAQEICVEDSNQDLTQEPQQ